MAGITEFLNPADKGQNDAVTQGILQAGLAMMASRGTLRQALGYGGMAGIGGYQNAQEGQFLQKQRAQQQTMWDEQNRQMAQQQKLRELAPQFQRSATQNAMAGGGGPTVANAQNLSTSQPSFDWEGYIKAIEGVDPEKAMQLRAVTQKDNSPLTVKEGETLYDRKTLKPILSQPKSDSVPSAIKEYEYAKNQGFGGSFQDFEIAKRRAGASSVNVSTGQKGFDNTLKLRGDFRAEPVYKAHQEMTSAYAQIQQALKQASPAGDLAGATKVMKLLDPGSVVRESELGMAMQASGLLDRVQHYATNVLNGTKLTPDQRKDFQRLADALYGESVKQYNGKRSEYEGISTRNGLNTADVLGPPSDAPKGRVVNFGDLR
jgi:hypothetical protein